jgi:TonB family protein
MRIDLEQEPGSGSAAPSSNDGDIPIIATRNAAEHAAIFEEPSQIVSQAVQPGYPLLAKQMKVQGSVILQALVGRDGFIQNLHVVSGPPILASAAQEAVKQWHFKPHYEGAEPVETEAKITVNFVISTN